MGNRILGGRGFGGNAVKGIVRVCLTSADIKAKLQKGDILAVGVLSDEDVPVVASRAAGVIAEDGGLTSAAAFIYVICGRPVILGAERATDLLKDGVFVTLDPAVGAVYEGDISL